MEKVCVNSKLFSYLQFLLQELENKNIFIWSVTQMKEARIEIILKYFIEGVMEQNTEKWIWIGIGSEYV